MHKLVVREMKKIDVTAHKLVVIKHETVIIKIQKKYMNP